MLQWNSKVMLVVLTALLLAVANGTINFTWLINFTW